MQHDPYPAGRPMSARVLDLACAMDWATEHPTDVVTIRCDTLLALHAERAELRGAIHGLVHPDNGYCTQCRGHWNYRTDGTWNYDDGEHTDECRAWLAYVAAPLQPDGGCW